MLSVIRFFIIFLSCSIFCKDEIIYQSSYYYEYDASGNPDKLIVIATQTHIPIIDGMYMYHLQEQYKVTYQYLMDNEDIQSKNEIKQDFSVQIPNNKAPDAQLDSPINYQNQRQNGFYTQVNIVPHDYGFF